MPQQSKHIPAVAQFQGQNFNPCCVHKHPPTVLYFGDYKFSAFSFSKFLNVQKELVQHAK
jgi:hypothetical protein